MDPWKVFLESLPRHPKPEREDPIRLVCFDLDGVLLEQESSWVAVHEHFGVTNEASLHAFLRGEITDEEFIRRDVALWKQRSPRFTMRQLEAVLDGLKLVPRARSTVKRLQNAGVTCAIVSSGLEPAAHATAKKLGIPHVSANGLHTDARGRLTGTGVVRTPLRDKAQPLRRLARELGVRLEQVASVGNSVPDIAMFRSSGLAIAFRAADDATRRAADVVVPGPGLEGVLDPILEGNVRAARSMAVGGI